MKAIIRQVTSDKLLVTSWKTRKRENGIDCFGLIRIVTCHSSLVTRYLSLVTRYPLLIALSLLLSLSTIAYGDSSIRGAFAFSGFSNGASTRAMGMNGAFTAVSDDSSAAFWNPAGLSQSWCKELSFSRTNLYDLDLIISNSLIISAPETKSNSRLKTQDSRLKTQVSSLGAFSLGWNRLQFALDDWLEEVFLVSYAKTLVNTGEREKEREKENKDISFNLSFGLSLKYLRQTSDLKLEIPESSPQSEVLCNADGLGLDAGLLAGISASDGRNLASIGIVTQDIPTYVRWNSESDIAKNEYLPCRYKAGFSFEPLPRMTVALDLVGEQTKKWLTLKELHLGIENWFFPTKRDMTSVTKSSSVSEKNIAIRCGVARQIGDSRMTYAAGLGLRWAAWQLDYAYLMDNNGLGDTKNRFSISVRF